MQCCEDSEIFLKFKVQLGEIQSAACNVEAIRNLVVVDNCWNSERHSRANLLARDSLKALQTSLTDEMKSWNHDGKEMKTERNLYVIYFLIYCVEFISQHESGKWKFVFHSRTILTVSPRGKSSTTAWVMFGKFPFHVVNIKTLRRSGKYQIYKTHLRWKHQDKARNRE